jgi:shikimate kinase
MKETPGWRQNVGARGEGRNAPVRAVFLVGFMGAGKTSVGRALGGHLAWRFVDLDDRIRSLEGRSIPEIFQNSGEGRFRELERAALRDVLAEIESGPPLVVALGGGAFAQPEIVALLAESESITIFLDAPPDELWRRCSADRTQRPLRRNEAEFHHLYDARRPLYLEASVKIETAGRNIDQIVQEIVRGLKLNSRVSGEER